MIDVDKTTFEEEVLKADGYVLIFMEMDVFLVRL